MRTLSNLHPTTCVPRSGFLIISLIVLLFLSACASVPRGGPRGGGDLTKVTSNAQYNPANLRSYNVRGRTYHPKIPRKGHEETGIATWYGYESPNRTAATLADMAAAFGAERAGALCRELTKAYETVVTASLGELAEKFDGEDRIRGEVVLLVGPPVGDAVAQSEEDIDRLLLSLAAELPPSKAAGEAARMTGGQKSVLYQRLMQLKSDQR